MPSFIMEILEGNFFEKCVEDSFISLNCILGSSAFIISILIISLDCYAFYKLAKYFHKINFETSLILMNIIQIVIIQLLIITSYELLFECFNFVQIGMLTWIIRKFNILLNNPIKSFKKNRFFIFFNIINLTIIIYYNVMIFIKSSYDYNYPIILIHTSLSLLSTFILLIYSRSLINQINKINKIERESVAITFDSTSELNHIFLMNANEEESSQPKNFEFYSKREKQIKPLYSINLICIFFQFSFVLSIILFPNINYEKESYKVLPKTNLSQIFYYIFILVCLINSFTNFFCFFWRIKSQYQTNNRKSVIPIVRNTIIDIDYIDKKKNEIEKNKDGNKQIDNIFENDMEKNGYNIKINKSLFISSFEDLSLDKQNSNNISNQNPEKSKDILIEENCEKNEEKNDENIVLNNENKERESIPLDLDSPYGINRISRNTVSIIEEEK